MTEAELSDERLRQLISRAQYGEMLTIAGSAEESALSHDTAVAPTELQRHRAAQATRKAQTDADAFGGTSGHIGEDGLLPCPFCGGAAEYERLGTPRASTVISCTQCGCRLESAPPTWDQAMDWNRRTPDIARGEGAATPTEAQLLDAFSIHELEPSIVIRVRGIIRDVFREAAAPNRAGGGA